MKFIGLENHYSLPASVSMMINEPSIMEWPNKKARYPVKSLRKSIYAIFGRYQKRVTPTMKKNPFGWCVTILDLD